MSLFRHLLNVIFLLCISTLILSHYALAGERRGIKVDLGQQVTAYIDVPKLNAIQKQAYKDAKTFSIVVDQTYKYDKTKQIDGYTLPFQQFTIEIFERLGIRHVGDSPNKITLKINGITNCVLYNNSPRYTAANVTGVFTLKLEGAPAIEATFEMQHPAPQSISIEFYKTPSFAPFSDAYDAYIEMLCDIIGQAFGWNSILPIVESNFNIPNPFRPLGDGKGDGPVGNLPSILGMRSGPIGEACNVLARAGADGVYVLIEALQNSRNIKVKSSVLYALEEAEILIPLDLVYPFLADEKISNSACGYLRTITKGQLFGKDVEKWKAWIEENSQIFSAADQKIIHADVELITKEKRPEVSTNTLVPKTTETEPEATFYTKAKRILPAFTNEFPGGLPVRIRNPNEFAVVAGIRPRYEPAFGNFQRSGGKDLEVPANGVKTTHIPAGEYDIYFVYSNKPDALFQGDWIQLIMNGIEIQIVKVVNGNYSIRQVK